MKTFRMIVLAVIAAIAIGGLTVEARRMPFQNHDDDCGPKSTDVLYKCIRKFGTFEWKEPLKCLCEQFEEYFTEENENLMVTFRSYLATESNREWDRSVLAILEKQMDRMVQEIIKKQS
eukprot:GHVS01002417.1.p1 GENE.GHVS01002417.1~~GHVS01002417.1.p1  ORF type:complete len:119 (-),score=9.63 GHVS01002417.1:158-514(-)